jgi:3-deoxy-D-manno-octulosonic-acid transferase
MVHSLGEYEQGLPIIERIKEEYHEHKIIISFFHQDMRFQKNNAADVTSICLWIRDRMHSNSSHPYIPKWSFIKYEFWPNYLNELKQKKYQPIWFQVYFSKTNIFQMVWFLYKALMLLLISLFKRTIKKKLLLQIGKTNVASQDTPLIE